MSENKTKELGSIIQERRLGMNLNVLQLSKATGIKEKSIRELEGGGNCKLKTILTVCDYLRLSIQIK